jgi:phosphate transport system permease protein
MTSGGIFPAIFGTMALVLVMSVIVAPAGVFVAIYFSEYADRRSWFYYISRQAVNNLAGVPSIVFGLFGLGFFVQFVGKGLDRVLNGGELAYGQPGLLWAALTMAVLTLPVVVVSVEEALQSVPRSYREASYALGSTKSQAVFRVVLPHAMPGVLTGSVLAVSRAAGEVAPILFVGAAYFLPHIPTRLNDQFMHLGYHVFIMSTQSPDVDATKPLLYSTVFVLLALTFILNAVAVLIRARMRIAQRSF